MIAAIHKDVDDGILLVAVVVGNHRYVLELLGLQVIHIESVLLGRNPKVVIPVGGYGEYGLFADGTLKGRHAVKHILVSVDGFYAIVFRTKPKVALGVGKHLVDLHIRLFEWEILVALWQDGSLLGIEIE
jgi:hypothetical protein